MSDLIYRKSETVRTDSPIDKKAARIDAFIRITLLIGLLVVFAGVMFISISSLNVAKQNKAILEAVVSNQHDIAYQAASSKDIQHQLLILTRKIENCNTPNGICYQRRIAELAEQTGQINAISLAAIFCHANDDTLTYEQLTTCVMNLTRSNKR